MNGAEHKAKAEKLLKDHYDYMVVAKQKIADSPNLSTELPAVMQMANSMLLKAQVHATLALAEATLVVGQVTDWDGPDSS